MPAPSVGRNVVDNLLEAAEHARRHRRRTSEDDGLHFVGTAKLQPLNRVDSAAGRTESAEALSRFAMGFSAQLQTLIETNDRRLAELRAVVEERLQHLQKDNAARLEEMRRTVDEKLHATLEQRLGESFKLVSERLEAVHKGLGEMQNLAAGVGDLKRVLTNVKSRGTWGEVQLARLV